jgi:hypothetical protein
VAVDAFRGGGGGGRTPSAPVPAPDTATGRREAQLVERLAGERIGGVLLYSTAVGCELRAIRLPSLEPAPVPEGGGGLGCRFTASPDGSRVAPPGAAWSPDGRLLALCLGGATSVERATGGEVYRVDGCAASWRSSNALVVVENESTVVQWLVDCHRGRDACRRVLLDHHDLEAAARGHPQAFDAYDSVRVRVVGTAWLDGDLLVLRLRSTFVSAGSTGRPVDSVVAFAGRELAWAGHATGRELLGLETAPRGNNVFAGPDDVYHARGFRLSVPRAFGAVRAGALSPDDRWLALAAPGAVILLPTNELHAEPRALNLPLDAAGLAWR